MQTPYAQVSKQLFEANLDGLRALVTANGSTGLDDYLDTLDATFGGQKGFFALMLLLQTGLLGVFCAFDIAQQLEVMTIARNFADAGGGVVAVMHDLNLTAMFADQIVLMSEGSVLADGRPDAVMTDDTLSRAYRCDLRVSCPPSDNQPFLLPHAARAAAE